MIGGEENIKTLPCGGMALIGIKNVSTGTAVQLEKSYDESSPAIIDVCLHTGNFLNFIFHIYQW